jgi:hypothetical protein
MNRIFSYVVALVALGVAGAHAQQQRPAQQTIQGSDRFNGTLTVQNKAGATAQLQVNLRNWSLLGEQRPGERQGTGLREFPVKGFLMAHLLAGRVHTVINGTSREWKEGDVWTLPTNASMMIEVLGETAVLQTLSVGPER